MGIGSNRTELQRIEDEIRLDHLERVAAILRRKLDEEHITTTGRLKNSIRVNVTKNKVVMIAPYAYFVEYGRAKGARMPPFKKIRAWVRTKLRLTDRKQVHSVTWAIMVKMKKKGIEPTHVLSRAWNEAMKESQKA